MSVPRTAPRYAPSVRASTKRATQSPAQPRGPHYSGTRPFERNHGSRSMPESTKVVMATDGSEAAIDAARRSMKLLHPDAHVAVVMVIPQREDPEDDAGGFEGPVL